MKTAGCYSASMRATIALFDIDGTLLRAGGAGRRAVERALDDLLGEAHGTITLEAVEFAGRTDPWIVREALRHNGVAADEGLVAEVLRLYVEYLPGELERAPAFEVLPGVRALLDALSTRDDTFLGLGTGNTKKAAYAKLRRGALDSFFAFGGFGSDHLDRAELLRVGFERARARIATTAHRVVVIGDTPHDVVAAHAIGAECIAVCTGWYDKASLKAAGANHVVADLEEAKVLDAIIGARAISAGM